LKKIALPIALILLSLLTLSIYDRAIPSENEKTDEERQMGLADHFMKIGEYSQAITEYRRFIYIYPMSKRIEEAYFRIGEVYFIWGRYGDAISSLKRTVQRFPEGSYLSDSRILLARSLMEIRRLEEAREILEDLLLSSPAGMIKDRARYWLAESFVREERWKDAIEVLEGTDLKSPFRRDAERYASHLKGIDQIPSKSPEVAGVLSALLPGAGHLYCERPMDALTAFLANAAFIAGAIEAFEKDQKALGVAFSAIELVFYGGTIFSAITSAHKFNREKKKEYLRGMQIKMGFYPEGNRGFLVLRISY